MRLNCTGTMVRIVGWVMWGALARQSSAQPCPPVSAPRPLNSTATTDTATDSAAHCVHGGSAWLAVWSSTHDLGGTVGADRDLLGSRSADGGFSWSVPQAVNINAAVDSGSDKDPRLATDGLGNWVLVWSSDEDLNGTIGSDSDVLVARSADGGVTWSQPVALNSTAALDSGVDWNPEVTTDGQGTWIAVWESSDTLGGTLGTDLDILVAVSTNQGQDWSPAAALHDHAASDTGIDRAARLATGGPGVWLAVWESDNDLGAGLGDDFDILAARSIDGGASWGPVQILQTNAAVDDGADLDPQVQSGGRGTWMAVWASSSSFAGLDGDPDIVRAVSSDDGLSWSAPAAVNNGGALDDAFDERPDLATDGTGTWIAVWQHLDFRGGALGEDMDVRMAYSLNDGLSWTGPLNLNASAATDSGFDERPSLATDGQGNWIAVWESRDDLDGSIDTDRDILVADFSLSAVDCDLSGVPDACEENVGPQVTGQPSSQVIDPGGLAILTVAAEGILLEYQWRMNGTPLRDSATIIGSNTTILLILDFGPSDSGVYDCVIHDFDGCQMISASAALVLAGSCPGDLGGDGMVDAADLSQLLGAWGPHLDHPADLNGDQAVDGADLALLLGAWGRCPRP